MEGWRHPTHSNKSDKMLDAKRRKEENRCRSILRTGPGNRCYPERCSSKPRRGGMICSGCKPWQNPGCGPEPLTYEKYRVNQFRHPGLRRTEPACRLAFGTKRRAGNGCLGRRMADLPAAGHKNREPSAVECVTETDQFIFLRAAGPGFSGTVEQRPAGRSRGCGPGPVCSGMHPPVGFVLPTAATSARAGHSTTS
jgi:hypothetical protein